MRFLVFILGLVIFLVGAASNFESVPLPFDCTSVVCSIGAAALSLDVVLMVGGVFLIMISWLMWKLRQ